MTVLSRALTGEKPTDRFEDIRDLVEDLQKCGCPKKLIDVMLREHFTNERALFIAAMRGEIEVTIPPLNKGDEGRATGTPDREAPEVKQAVRDTPSPSPASPTPAGKTPVVPWSPGAGSPGPQAEAVDDAERTALIKRLQDYNTGLRLPVEVFNRHRERGVAYPEGAVARLEYLRALPMSWLRYIVTGAGK
jgi:hypothetical protein